MRLLRRVNVHTVVTATAASLRTAGATIPLALRQAKVLAPISRTLLIRVAHKLGCAHEPISYADQDATDDSCECCNDHAVEHDGIAKCWQEPQDVRVSGEQSTGDDEDRDEYERGRLGPQVQASAVPRPVFRRL